jgi:hypothetical protein
MGRKTSQIRRKTTKAKNNGTSKKRRG